MDYHCEMDQGRQKTTGLLSIVTADSLFRKKAHEVMRENKTEPSSLSAAFQYVLKEHRDYWC